MSTMNLPRWTTTLIVLAQLHLPACTGCPGGPVDDPDGGKGPGSSGGAGSGSSRAVLLGSSTSGSQQGGSGTSGGSSGASNASGGSAGTASSTTGEDPPDAARPAPDAGPSVVDLAVTPDPAILDVTPAGGDLTLEVQAVLEDGSRRPARSPFIRSEAPQIGTTTALTFHATGERSGVAPVRVRAEGQEKRINVTVRVHETAVEPGSPPDVETGFGGPVGDAGNAPTMAYPYNNVVIPLNLAPILFQWRSPLGGAWYHLRVEGAHGSLDLYTTQNRVQPSADAWRRLLLAHAGGQLTATLESTTGPGAERFVAAQTVIRLANADLTATVYYWALNLGRIVRIDANSLAPTLLDTQPSGSCVACHALSADGQRLAFTFFGGNEPGGVINPSQPTVNIIGPDGSARWNFAAISPNNSMLLTNYGRELVVRDGTNGALASAVANPIATEAAHPAWSPTGDMVAYASDIRDASGGTAPWEIDFSLSDMTLRSISALTGVPGDVQRVIPGNGSALFYPNFSPGGVWLIYNRGVHSRSGNDAANVPYPASIELADTAAGGGPMTLGTANPGNDSYMPTFSPFVEGGYLWVAFFSRRDYGVVLEGTRRRQIWVAAVNQNPQPGEDPSHPAFYLPGQDISTENMSAFFAPVPCVDAGGTCESDLGCCNGNLCRPNTSGQLVCTPPGQACNLPQDACATDDDCCPGAGPCFDDGSGQRKCTPPELQCRMEGQACQFDDDCCVNAGSCFGGTGTFLCTRVENQCRQQQQTCTQDAECCPGAGTCFDVGGGVKKCVPAEAQCRQNGLSCSATQPCCANAGSCFTHPGTGTSTCLLPEQTCRVPMESCTMHSDCCSGTNTACVPEQGTGMLQCLTPTQQCRTLQQPCTRVEDCCAAMVCENGMCESIGG